MSYVHITVAFIFLAAYSTQGVNVKSQKKIICRFAGKEYSPGDLWYPQHDGHCIQCSCLITSKLNCTKEECPRDCPGSSLTPVEQQKVHPCCKSCSEPNSSSPFHGRGPSSLTSLIPNTDSATSGHLGHSQSQSHMGRGGGGSGSSSLIGDGIGRGSNNNPNNNNNNPAGSQTSGEADEEDENFVTENSEFVSCLHQGKIYRDGESFTANVSGLPISAIDQCMQCTCQSGMVLCQLVSCSSFKCGSSSSSSSNPTSMTSSSDTCCQRCSAWRAGKGQTKFDDRDEEDSIRKFSSISIDKDSKDASISIPIQMSSSSSMDNNNNHNRNNENNFGISSASGSILPESSITFRDISGNGNNNNNGQDCISGGRFYMHGSSWHPVIGPFGVMECVVCRCTNGQIECGRLKCPAKKDMPCSKPAKVEGHCCPICYPIISTASLDGTKMCVSAKQDLTAFRSHGFDSNGTEYIQFGFVKHRANSEPQVDQHQWTLRDGEILQFTTKYMSEEEFSFLRSRQVFVLLGATNEKNLEKFTRREKKLEKRCKISCGIRISGLERSLRIHRLTSRKQCLAQERIVTST